MADSRVAVEALHSADPQFQDICKALFGAAETAHDVWASLYTPDGTQELVSKMMPDAADIHVMGVLQPTGKKRSRRVRKDEPMRGRLVPTTTSLAKAVDAFGEQLELLDLIEEDELEEVEKDDSSVALTWAGEFSKADADKREVFGWASIVQVDGQPVVDRQGDLITPEELERAAYSYVQKSRVGGSQHRREGETPFHASNMIESLVLTPEKIEKMGLPESTPIGWWVGYKVHDDETWEKIKKGEQTGFSIHGRGRRTPVDEAA